MTKFNKPTNQWIEEDVEIPVTTPELADDGSVSYVQGTKKVRQRTFYADSKPTKLVCNDHTYQCIDKGKYVFKCTKCDWHQIAYPVTYRFDEETGKLTRR